MDRHRNIYVRNKPFFKKSKQKEEMEGEKKKKETYSKHTLKEMKLKALSLISLKMWGRQCNTLIGTVCYFSALFFFCYLFIYLFKTKS